MANIGSFKKSGNEYQGEIVTLSVQAKGVRIVPEANRSNDKAPSHRVFVGRAEIGAAWSRRAPALSVNTMRRSLSARRGRSWSGPGSLCRTGDRSCWNANRAPMPKAMPA